ncbi:ABC transporter permease protein (plasmid) [Nostoc carneum NIES-2107]|nr:ABC transporter permease protein [Nostoc carneum NIES-2107]
MNYLLHLLIYVSVYAIVAMSLNLIVGYCGLLTLAHAAYFALGGYVYALTSLKLGWGFLPATLAGVTISCLLSLAVSLPSWRFKGDFFVMVSLAVQALLFGAFSNWVDPTAEIGTLTNLTNGTFGLSGIPKPNLFGLHFNSIGSVAIFSVTIALLCAVLSGLLVFSPWGRLLQVMRDDELAARGLGKDTRLAKVQAFAIACGMVAVAGAIRTAYIGFLDPTAAALDESILMLCMVIVGGVGNFRGPLVGAFILITIPELLRFAMLPDSIAANIRLLIYGLLLVLMMHFRPQGIAGKHRLG